MAAARPWRYDSQCLRNFGIALSLCSYVFMPVSSSLADIAMLRCSDGVSMAILRSELTAIYVALRAGRQPAELAPLPIQYADYAAWQHARLDGGELGAQACQVNDRHVILGCQTLHTVYTGTFSQRGLSISSHAAHILVLTCTGVLPFSILRGKHMLIA